VNEHILIRFVVGRAFTVMTMMMILCTLWHNVTSFCKKELTGSRQAIYALALLQAVIDQNSNISLT